MKLGKIKITNKGLYWGLIITFAILYLCVGFVSTLHSITFFGLANTIPLAVLLGLTYEVGQASVLFSILMTKNKDKFLPWALMILLTALQVTANVYASFKFMVQSGSSDWTFWQKSILFGVQASNPEMYQMIISWISGALLPIVALGMTALVAENMKMMNEEVDEKPAPVDEGEKKVQEFLNHEFKTPEIDPGPSREEQLELLKDKLIANTVSLLPEREEKAPKDPESGMKVIQKPIQINLQSQEEANKEFADRLAAESKEGAAIPTKNEIDEIIENEVQKRMAEIPLESILSKYKNMINAEDNPQTEISEIIDDGGISGESVNIEELDDMDKEVLRLTDDVTIQPPKNKMEEYIQTSPLFKPDEKDVHEISNFINDQIINDLKEGKHLEAQYEKDLIVEPLKKQRGRPPKQKDKVVELKKVQESLPKEEVKVLPKQKRSVNPLKLKSKKIRPIKNLNDINKPSKGDEALALLEKLDKAKQKDSITHLSENNQDTHDSLLVPPELKDDFKSFILNGVEVIDARAVPVKKHNAKHDTKVDKFGIPIQKGENLNFDRI